MPILPTAKLKVVNKKKLKLLNVDLFIGNKTKNTICQLSRNILELAKIYIQHNSNVLK